MAASGMSSSVELVVGGLESAGLGYRTEEEEISEYDLRIGKEKAAMRKEQKLRMEGGWMRCAGCGKVGNRRCAGCFMTIYCDLECHKKHWWKGHRARCREVRKEFVEVVLKTEFSEEYEEYRMESIPKSYFTVLVSVNSRFSEIFVMNEDSSVVGDLSRLAGQEEAYDQIRKVVEEQGLVEELDETGEKAGTFEKVSSACFFGQCKGQTGVGNIKLKLNIKQVQPMVMW